MKHVDGTIVCTRGKEGVATVEGNATQGSGMVP